VEAIETDEAGHTSADMRGYERRRWHSLAICRARIDLGLVRNLNE
jgi:hypothetical protein